MNGAANGTAGDLTTIPYVISSALRQRLDLIHHLIGFGRQIIVVTGPQGSGRGRLLETVSGESNPQWLLIELDGRRVATPIELLAALLDALEPIAHERPSNAEDLEARVCRQLAQIHADQRVAVLVANDCDGWDDAINALLFRLAHTDNGVGELRIVISCEDSSDYLERLQATTEWAALLHVIEVPPLDRDEVAALIEAVADRLALGAEPRPDADVDELARQSAGNPARLFELLRDSKPPRSARWLALGGRLRRFKSAAGISLVAVAALALAALTLVSREQNMDPDEGIELALPGVVDDRTAAVEPLVPAARAAEPREVATEPLEPLPASTAPPVDEGVDEAAVTPRPPTRDTVPGDSSQTSAVSDAAAAIPAVSNATAPPPLPPPSTGAIELAPPPTAPPASAPPRAATAGGPSAARPAPAKAVPVRPREASGYNTEWVLTHSDTTYVIQLFGARDRSSAERFIRDHAVAGRAIIFDLEHEAAAWHVVVFGHYRDRAAANAAISTLSEPLRRAAPWSRSVGSLRK